MAIPSPLLFLPFPSWLCPPCFSCMLFLCPLINPCRDCATLSCSHMFGDPLASWPDLALSSDRPGTWDLLLQCLHLDKPLLQKQNTKKLYGLKITMCMCNWGKLWTERYKGPKSLTATSEEPEGRTRGLAAKAGY